MKSRILWILSSILMWGLVGGAYTLQQTGSDGAHSHPRYETAISQHSTQIATLSVTQVAQLPSITTTSSPTRTSTPLSMPPTPTPEEGPGMTRTALTDVPVVLTNTIIPTNTPRPPSGSPTSTLLPYLQPDYLCRVTTTSALTKRLLADVTSQSLGVIPTNTVVTIYPYESSIYYPNQNGNIVGRWYVKLEDESWILFANVATQDATAPGTTPAILEQFMTELDFPCRPQVIRR